MFIMPGIDSAAPERTETSSGLAGSPNFLPTSVSICLRAASTCGHGRLGELLAVLVVGGADLGGDGEAGGDGDADELISARLAPLPPSRSFMSALPSALPPPNE